MSDPNYSMPPVYSAPAPAVASKNTPGLIAMILAIVAFVLGVIPGASFLAWLPAIAAIILAIIALVKKGAPKKAAVAAIIIAPIAWLIAIIVSIALIASGAGSSIEEGFNDGLESTQSDSPSSEAPIDPAEPSEEPADDGEARIGETLTNNDGVSVTFTSVTCGIAVAGPEFLEETAKGQFCEVRLQVQNGSDAQISLYSSDITGRIGTAEYESNTIASSFGGESFYTDLNPGLGTEGVVFIDIPADAALEYVVYRPLWSFLTDEIRVKVE